MDYLTLIGSFLVVSVTISYLYVKRKYSFWARQGIDGPKPIPIFGNLLEQMKRGQIVTEMEWVAKYGKVYGSYSGSLPVLCIYDPELIKQVLVKDFSLFVNRRNVRAVDENFSKNLFNLEGEDWKRVRAITSPAFTSGKLRGMNALMHHCVDKLAAYFEKISQDGVGVINTKEVVAGFTIDVIASTSFATETDANGDRSKKNAFVENGMELFRVNFFRLAIQLTMPQFTRKLVNKLLPNESAEFFVNLAKGVVQQRRQTGVKRNDFVQLLMDAYVEENDLKSSNYDRLTASDEKDDETQAENGKAGNSKKLKTLTDNEIIAQCILFFIAGFETTASAISHTIFHLARSQEVQDRLLEDITQALDGVDINSEQYFDTVMNKIPYLDAVIKETLRLYPPLVRLERRVSVDNYKLGGITLEKEQLVNIGTYAVHRNPEYYPDPETYDPERFMPENKHLLVPYTWLPFGHGPRNCIGMRFAYQEIKLCLAKILPQFKFSPSAETPEQLTFAKVGLLSVNPFSLKVSKR